MLGEKAPPVYRTGLSTGSVRSQGAIMLVKNVEFDGVAEEPEGMMDRLAEMSGSNKKKIAPIPLTEQDLIRRSFRGQISRSRRSALPPCPVWTRALPLKMGAATMITARSLPALHQPKPGGLRHIA